MDRTRSTVNRIVLLGGGCVLLGVAATAALASHSAATGFVPHRWASHGGHWPDFGTWAAGSGRSVWERAATVIALLAAFAAAGLLFLQLRRRILKRLRLNSPNHTVEGRAVTTAVAARLLALPGVTSARTSLHGPPGKTFLRTRLVVDDTASPAQLLTALATATLPEVRGFLAPHAVAAQVRITVRGHRRLK